MAWMRNTIFVAWVGVFALGCGGGGSGGGMAPPPVPANSAPLVSAANSDQSAQVGRAFSYDAAQAGVFSDPDGDALTYTVSLAGASGGLAVNGAVISGTPTDAGTVTATVTATDPSGARVSDSFTITIDPATAARVNILFLIADDLGQDSSAQYSLVSDVPDTPTLNDLARNGLVFENLWVNPTCSPTRAALLTGRYGTRTGVVAVGGALNPAETVIHKQLANVAATFDYKSALIGKWHLGGGATGPNDVGIEHFAGILGGGVRDYFDWTLNVNGVESRVSTYATTEITDQAIDWAGRQTNPWFMWVAYNAPHTPFHLPPSTLHNRTLSGDQTDINANPRPYYLAAIEAMDAEIGRLLSSLDPKARANTIVIFVGDNGTPNRVNNDAVFPNGAKGNLYEGGVRVPMIVSGAGVTRIGERENALINGVDFFASIAELAGQTLPSLHDARSFLSLLTDDRASSRDYIFTEGQNGQAIRDERYKLIRNSDGSLELYDLATDPTESLNIAWTSALSMQQAELGNALDELLNGGN